MGRRSTKSSPAMGAAPSFDTVGVTILPGVSLPEWAEPRGHSETPAGPELIADSEPAGQVEPGEAVAPESDAQAHPVWAAASAPTSPEALVGTAARAPEPAFAMAGAVLVGATAGAATTGYGQPDPGYGAEPSRYPVAPAAGYPAAPAASAMPGYAPGSVPGSAPAAEATVGYAPAVPPPVGAAPSGPALGGPAPAYEQGWAASAASAAAAPPAHASTTSPMTGPTPGAPEAAGLDPMNRSAAPPTPSEAWGSPERATLSPQHVALLSWWADMMAAGQLPAPTSVPGPGPGESQPTPSGEARTRSVPLKAAALSLVAVAAIGAAAVVGPKVLAADEAVVVPATEVSMPATVGGLVAITDPAVGAELETLLGFGLRPMGVTVTSAYGPAADGPLSLAAMATTMGAPAEAVGQIAAWAERTGATVAPSVAGTGANEGITCAAVEAIPEAQPGSICVWSASGNRGQTYSVALSVEDAQTLTNQVRTSVTGS